MKLAELAEHLGAKLHGDPEAQISRVAGLETAGVGDLTFVANPKYAALARTTKATAVLVEPGLRVAFAFVISSVVGIVIGQIDSGVRLNGIDWFLHVVLKRSDAT